MDNKKVTTKTKWKRADKLMKVAHSFTGGKGNGSGLIVKDRENGHQKFDQKKYHDDYVKMLKEIGQVFTAKNHPEWATKAKIIKWVKDSRKQSERNFDDVTMRRLLRHLHSSQ